MSFIDEIVKIESVDCESLRYDITVADNHNFFANQINNNRFKILGDIDFY